MSAPCLTSKTQVMATKELLAVALNCAVGSRLGTGGQSAAGACSKAMLTLTKWRKMGLVLHPATSRVGGSLLKDQGTLNHGNQGQCDPAPKSGGTLGSPSLHWAGSGSWISISAMRWTGSR